jgi:hypothetical protein
VAASRGVDSFGKLQLFISAIAEMTTTRLKITGATFTRI